MANRNPQIMNFRKAINFNYKWIISDFRSIGDNIETPVLIFEKDPELTWRLRIEKCFSRTSYESYDSDDGYDVYDSRIECYAVKISVASNDVLYGIQSNCKFQLLSASPEKNETWETNIRFNLRTYYDCFKKLASEIVDPQNGFLQNGNITLTCDIRGLIDISINNPIPKCSLSNDLQLMFEHAKFSDVTLCVSGKEIQAHKGILAARSSVFNAMFQHEMMETTQNRVVITDINCDVFEQLLRFIYTGEVLNLKDFAIELLSAANKYEIERLKVLCEKELCTNISIENAAEILVLADIYNLKQLKIVTLGYISVHAVDVIKTDGWKAMVTSNSDLVTEVVGELAVQLHVMKSLQKP